MSLSRRVYLLKVLLCIYFSHIVRFVATLSVTVPRVDYTTRFLRHYSEGYIYIVHAGVLKYYFYSIHYSLSLFTERSIVVDVFRGCIIYH